MSETQLQLLADLVIIVVMVFQYILAHGTRLEVRAMQREKSQYDISLLEQKQQGQKVEAEANYQQMTLTTMQSILKTNDATLTLLSRAQDAHDAEIGIRQKNSSLIKNIGESQTAMQTVLDTHGKRLEAIQNQEQKLQQTQEMITAIGEQISKLPDDVQTKLTPLLAQLLERLTQIQTDVHKIDTDVNAVKTEIDQALTQALSQRSAPPAPIVNNLTVNPAPNTLPEQPKSVDATQKLGDTLPAVEPDPTRPVVGGMPNGQPTTEGPKA